MQFPWLRVSLLLLLIALLLAVTCFPVATVFAAESGFTMIWSGFEVMLGGGFFGMEPRWLVIQLLTAGAIAAVALIPGDKGSHFIGLLAAAVDFGLLCSLCLTAQSPAQTRLYDQPAYFIAAGLSVWAVITALTGITRKVPPRPFMDYSNRELVRTFNAAHRPFRLRMVPELLERGMVEYNGDGKIVAVETIEEIDNTEPAHTAA